VIRVRVVAASPAQREGLESLVASSPEFTLTEAYPDVVLGAVPPDELAPAPAIVLIGEGAWTAEALRAGIRAILPADASASEILAAIQCAAAGLATVDPRDLEAILAANPQPVAAAPAPLTTRELEVLRMLAEGAANKTIAWKLSISEHTVKFHVAQILSKLNASTRTEAVTLGIRQGLILL